ncbi:MAG: rod shape-determining protein MreC [Bacteroidaceae bacterium]|nr:rod shape-determining protein MreC [Bacteroidaceae bacterium]
MNSIFQFLYKHLHWIVFIVLEIICFVLLFSYNSFQGSVYLSTAGNVTARMLNGKDKVTTYFGLAEKNRALAEQNALLQQRIVELEMLFTEHQLDSLSRAEAITRIHRAGYHISPAQVIAKSVNKTDNYLTIDRGTADGVEPDMGVIGIDGVVGTVFKCTEHYSLVMPLLNSDSYTSCKVLGSKDIGILQWNGGDARYAMLYDLPRYSDVKVGDTIVTSGNSSFFPEGVMVGRVEEAYPSTDGLYMTLKIQLSTQFSKLEHVFIMRKMDADELSALKELLNPTKKKK